MWLESLCHVSLNEPSHMPKHPPVGLEVLYKGMPWHVTWFTQAKLTNIQMDSRHVRFRKTLYQRRYPVFYYVYHRVGKQ